MKILLLSDATMSANAGGLSQTLYNIFSFLEPNNILCITSKRSFKTFPPDELFIDRYLTYRFEIVNVPRNRLAKYLDPFVDRFNYVVNEKFKHFKSIKHKVAEFRPDIVVSCSNGPTGLLMHYKILEGFSIEKVFPYFMDDWMFQKRYSWLDKKIEILTKRILCENERWLMISKSLSEILARRYKASPRLILEVHNPVNLSDSPDVGPVQKKTEYTLAYAGALWQMHFDAFVVVAKSVKELKKIRTIKILLYTTEIHWKWRRSVLEPLGIIYGGNIPYKDIHRTLAQADALILTSSFLEEWYTHSQGSIQTKITDYLKARRLIISCGPTYSANHVFLKKHDCGICIETNEVWKVSEALNSVLDKIEESQVYINNGWEVLQKEYSFDTVHNKVKHFLGFSE